MQRAVTVLGTCNITSFFFHLNITASRVGNHFEKTAREGYFPGGLPEDDPPEPIKEVMGIKGEPGRIFGEARRYHLLSLTKGRFNHPAVRKPR